MPDVGSRAHSRALCRESRGDYPRNPDLVHVRARHGPGPVVASRRAVPALGGHLAGPAMGGAGGAAHDCAASTAPAGAVRLGGMIRVLESLAVGGFGEGRNWRPFGRALSAFGGPSPAKRVSSHAGNGPWRLARCACRAVSPAENSRQCRQSVRVRRPDHPQVRFARVCPGSCFVLHPVIHRTR